MKRFKIFFIILCSVLAAKAQSIVFNNQVPKHEVRAVWLTTIGGIDWPHSYAQSSYSAEKQKKELTDILDRLQQAKINTVLIQTRVRGTMIYPSAYEPWDGCLSGFPGRSPGYDALQFAIDECHKRGMELHAWVVTIPVGKWNALGCKTLRQKMPKLIKKIGADGYMDPENSRTGDYLANICREITHKYNVDGIHLDYIRYPETWNIKVSREQGRQYITNIVRKIHDAVKAEKPWVKMSCSPVGKYDDLSRYRSFGWNAYTKVCQDAQGWLKSGLMDELFPMMYFKNEHFYPFAIDWQEQSHGKIVVPGLGIYFLDPKEGKWSINDVTAEMYHIRNLGMGYAFFRNKFLLDNKQGILDFTQRFNPYPSLVPPMTWASKNQPEQPQQLSVITTDNKVSVSWNNPSNYTDGTKIATPYIYNNVYASKKYPVDITDARNLVATRIIGNSFKIENPEAKHLFVAVTSMDGYGIESQPTQEKEEENPLFAQTTGAAKLLECDGKKVYLAETTKNLVFDVLMIETLQGCDILHLQTKDNTLDVRNLKEGTYRVVSINKKGYRHTLGTFRMKKNCFFFEKSCEKIWWNQKIVVPLHSQFRNEAFKCCTLSSVGRATDS